jgi:hypothetical protein
MVIGEVFIAKYESKRVLIADNTITVILPTLPP